MTEKVRLTKSAVKSDIESGCTRKALADKYGLPVTQMNAAIEIMGLKGLRAKKVLFEIVEETQEMQEPAIEEPVEIGVEGLVRDEVQSIDKYMSLD